MLSKPASTVHSCGNELLASFDVNLLTMQVAKWTNPLPTGLGGGPDLAQASRTILVGVVDRAPH
jgi:hypothetical protein